jgi:hypothetical protein
MLSAGRHLSISWAARYVPRLTSASSSQQRSASPACRCISAASCSTSSLRDAPMTARPTPLPRTLSSAWLAVDTKPAFTLTRWHKQPGPVQLLLPLLPPQAPPLLPPQLPPLLPGAVPQTLTLQDLDSGLSPLAGAAPGTLTALLSLLIGSADADRVRDSPVGEQHSGSPRCPATAAASCQRACVLPGGVKRADSRAKSSTQAAGAIMVATEFVRVSRAPGGAPATLGMWAATQSASCCEARPHRMWLGWSRLQSACVQMTPMQAHCGVKRKDTSCAAYQSTVEAFTGITPPPPHAIYCTVQRHNM